MKSEKGNNDSATLLNHVCRMEREWTLLRYHPLTLSGHDTNIYVFV
jgi:hypothetical protein